MDFLRNGRLIECAQTPLHVQFVVEATTLDSVSYIEKPSLLASSVCNISYTVTITITIPHFFTLRNNYGTLMVIVHNFIISNRKILIILVSKRSGVTGLIVHNLSEKRIDGNYRFHSHYK